MDQGVASGAPAEIAPRHHRLQARVLGRFEVTLDGLPVSPADWGRTSAERLFKLLLVTPGHRLSREAAGEHLWPGAAPRHQGTNLRKALHYARRAVSPEGDGLTILVADRTHVGLAPTVDLDLDLDTFTDSLERLSGSSGRSDDADKEAVLALGRDELLPDDPYEDWLAAPRERVAARWTAIALAEARTTLAAGNLTRAGALVDGLLARDPADEEAHRLAIQMLAAQGRHHAARRQFLECRRELAEAFGVEPSADTVATLAAALADTPVGPGPGAGRSPRLVGRDAELARIDEFVERLGAGRGGAFVLRGPAGIGKSRILDQAAIFLSVSGWRVLGARSVELERGRAFGALRSVFRTVTVEEVAAWPEPGASAMALLVPTLGLRPVMTFGDPAALASAVADAMERLTSQQPIVIAIDDAHWLDDGSADLLARLASATVQHPLVLMLAVRTDEPMSPAVRALLGDLARVDGDELDVGPLARVDVAPLVTPHLGGARMEPAVVEFLYERSEGNPLFCIELARRVRDEGRLVLRGGRWQLDGGAAATDVPPTVLRLVRARCSALAPETRRLLELAAEFEEPFGFDRLVETSESSPEQVLHGLDASLAGGLIVEVPAGYRFAHPLFRAAVREDLAPARRAAVALAVARNLAGRVDPFDSTALSDAIAAGVDPVAVAQRSLAATEAGLAAAGPLAVGFGLHAGLREAGLFQRQAALATFERSFRAWDRMTDPERRRFDVSPPLLARGRLLLAEHREAEARESFRRAIETGRDPEQIGAAVAELAFVDYRHGDYASSMAILNEGLSKAADDEVLRAILMIEIGWLEFRLQRLDDALAHLRLAETVFLGSGSEAWLMRALDCVWGPLESMGRGEEATPGLERALAIAVRRQDAPWESRIRVHIGFRCVGAGVPGQARPHLDRALSLARMTGDRLAESIGLWAAAEMEFALGDFRAADANLASELAIFASMGGNARQDAIAYAFRTHVARALGDSAAAARYDAEARTAAATASRGDAPFERRIHGYLDAPTWRPMSM